MCKILQGFFVAFFKLFDLDLIIFLWVSPTEIFLLNIFTSTLRMCLIFLLSYVLKRINIIARSKLRMLKIRKFLNSVICITVDIVGNHWVRVSASLHENRAKQRRQESVYILLVLLLLFMRAMHPRAISEGIKFEDKYTETNTWKYYLRSFDVRFSTKKHAKDKWLLL